MKQQTWPKVKLKYCVQLAKSRADRTPAGMPFIGLENIESWTGRRVTSEELGSSEEGGGTSTVNVFRAGDVVFGKLRPYLAKAWLAEFDGTCSTEGLVFRPADSVFAPFLQKSLLTKEFIDAVDETTFGSKMPRAEWDAIGAIKIFVPPLSSQCAIVTYLDRETMRLDQLVKAKEGLLELLAEKRRALIARAVTCGLNPKAPLRDSGYDWLGKIPKHWNLERSKWLFNERDERSANGGEEMLTVSHITGVTLRSEKNVNMFEAESNEGWKLCQPGDLVINTLWAWMGAMGTARVPGMVSPAYNVYIPNERLLPDYVDALVRIPAFAQEAIRFSKGVWSSRLRLYPEGLYEIWLPVPPIAEQRAIVSHIVTETTKLDALRSSAELTIRLLKERRSVLISAAVTGKISIPHAE